MFGFGLALLAASAAPVCGPATAPTIAENEVARVYRKGGRVFGCVAGGPRRIVAFEEKDLLSASLSGTLVLVLEDDPVPLAEGAQLRLMEIDDLRTGRRVWSDVGGYDSIAGFAAEPGGIAAWIERTGSKDLVRAVRGELDGHTITRRAAPVTDLAVAGRDVSFTAAGRRVSATLPSIEVGRVRVSPAVGSRTTRFAATFTAPAGAGPLDFFIATGSTQDFDDSLDAIACQSISLVGRRPAGTRVAVKLDQADRWCPGKNVGVVFGRYGRDDPYRCTATPMPCAGVLPLGTFEFRVRER